VYYEAFEGDDVTGPTDEDTVIYEVIMSALESENKITVKDEELNERVYSFAGSSFDIAYSEYIKNLYDIEESTADYIVSRVKGYWCSDPDSYLCFAVEGTDNVVYQEQWWNEVSGDVKGKITGGAKINNDLWLLIVEYYSENDTQPYMVQFITLDISMISSDIISISTDSSEMLEFTYAGVDHDSAYENVHGE